MGVVVGLNCNHADSAACIIKDNKLLFAVEEERINRIKHWAGLPIESIKLCLENTGTKWSEINDITINTNPYSNLHQKVFYFLKNYLRGDKKKEIYKRTKKKFNIITSINESLNGDKLLPNTKIHYVDHHLAHISSAFYASGYDKSIGLSIDGFGDFCSVAIAKCSEKEIKIIDRVYFPNSLGLFYEAFTQFIGFKNYGDEYKMMGLSASGNPKYYDLILKNIFLKKSNKLNLKFFNHTKKDFKYNFEGIPNQASILNENIIKLFDEKHDYLKEDVAASVQKIFENKLLEICKEASALDFSKNICYAGGCALNSLANKKLFDSGFFKNVFIPYAPGDAGGSIGSALYFLRNKEIKKENLNSPYLGPRFENNEIEKIIKNYPEIQKSNIEYISNKNDLFKNVASYISKNNIVGYFNGRMEFGARSLGNRSILANPCGKNIKEIINAKIKRRESFRPFAPAILEDKKIEWFENSKINPYMSNVENIQKNKRDTIPAVTHIDGTGRVQTVSKNLNEDFYNLIFEFYKITDVPILLNTSFNENEPIVMSPDHAIRCFLKTNMDLLVLNNYLITR